MKNRVLFLTILITCLLIGISCGSCRGDRSAPPSPEYVDKIRAARARLKPMDDTLIPAIIEEYNTYVQHGQSRWAERCLEYAQTFSQVERYTLYPAALVGGIAAHESAGCNKSASDWAGGRGLMQITSTPEPRWIRTVATILSIDPRKVDYRTDPLHNVMLGVVFLDDYERQLGSRPHGLLAYNMGPGGVRKTVRKMGYNPSRRLPTIVQMMPHLAHTSRMKPRVYVPRVLALAVMMDKAARGEPIEEITDLDLTDIPGADPSQDGAAWEDTYLPP